MRKLENRETMRIGPEEARELLGYNTHNRRLSRLRVERMARDMANGDWQNNNDVIKVFFIDDGPTVLINGQHRLEGVILSGTTQEFDVIWYSGSEEDCQKEFTNTDEVRRRSNEDAIQTAFTLDRGGYQSRDLSVAVRYLLFLELVIDGKQEEWRALRSSRIVQTVADHPQEVFWLVDLRRKMSLGARRTPNYGVMAAALDAYRVGGNLATVFYDTVATGDMISEGMPQYTLRRHLLGLPSSAGSNIPISLKTFRNANSAWNAFVQGRSLSFFIQRNEKMVRAIAPRKKIIDKAS